MSEITFGDIIKEIDGIFKFYSIIASWQESLMLLWNSNKYLNIF